jgi:hypothetical protein
MIWQMLYARPGTSSSGPRSSLQLIKHYNYYKCYEYYINDIDNVTYYNLNMRAQGLPRAVKHLLHFSKIL